MVITSSMNFLFWWRRMGAHSSIASVTVSLQTIGTSGPLMARQVSIRQTQCSSPFLAHMLRRALHLHLVFWQQRRAKTLIPNPLRTKGDRNKTANPVLSGQSAEYPEPVGPFKCENFPFSFVSYKLRSFGLLKSLQFSTD